MPQITAFFQFEKRALVAGLLAFFVLAFAVPAMATFFASLGPTDWVTQVKQYQFVLLVLVGAIVAWKSTRAPISNTIAVGFVGGLFSLVVAAYLGASPHLSATSFFFWYVIVTVGWCLLGGISVLLLRHKQHAL